MAEYMVEYTQERFFRGWVYAGSKEDAINLVISGMVEDLECYGTEIQDSIDVKEVLED